MFPLPTNLSFIKYRLDERAFVLYKSFDEFCFQCTSVYCWLFEKCCTFSHSLFTAGRGSVKLKVNGTRRVLVCARENHWPLNGLWPKGFRYFFALTVLSLCKAVEIEITESFPKPSYTLCISCVRFSRQRNVYSYACWINIICYL
jgi:hypothetical protein